MNASPHRRLAHVRVAEAMHRGVLSCPPDLPLSAVAGLMAEHRIHCVVVEQPGTHDAEGWSVVSDLDLVAAAAAGRLDEPAASGAAGTSMPRIGAGQPLMRAAELMMEHDVSHLVVVGEATGRPEGVLSTLDVATVLSAPSG
jgi:CBS domain-containing protein